MKKILTLLFLIGFSYQLKAQQESTKLFQVDYYPVPEFFDQIIIKSYAIVAIDDDSAKTVNDWFNSKDHKKLLEESSSVILHYSPDPVLYPIKEYKIK